MNVWKRKTKSATLVRSGMRRPNWLCRHVKQIVLLVRDRSLSMRGRKARDASTASLDLVADLADAANKDGFDVAVVDFAGTSKIVHNLAEATTLNGKVLRLKVGVLGDGTNITAGLEDACAILEKAGKESQQGITYLRPVVIVFTDGCHNEGPDPRIAATRLKGIADLVTVAFGADADESLMQSLASTHQHFYRCRNGRELRAFLAAVGATMTVTMAAGTDATQALTMIRQ